MFYLTHCHSWCCPCCKITFRVVLRGR